MATATLTDSEGCSITNVAYAREEETKKGMDGSQITGASSSYARKYALNGLFLIDDVKDSDTTNTGDYTKEDAEKYKLTFGKHKDKTLTDVYKEDQEYIEWLCKNTTSPEIAKFIELLFDMKKSDYDVSEEKIALTNDIMLLVSETEVDFEKLKAKYKINSLTEADDNILTEIKNKLVKLKETRAKVTAEN